jgi:hypothetical protein
MKGIQLPRTGRCSMSIRNVSRLLGSNTAGQNGCCRAALKTENFGGLFSAIYRLLIHRQLQLKPILMYLNRIRNGG